MADCIGAYTQRQFFPAAPEAAASAVRLDAITLVSPDVVRSGERVTLRIEGRVVEPSQPERRIVGFRLRELHTGDVVFASGTRSAGLTLEEGPLALDLELQMNVAPGLYTVETYVWHKDHDRDTLNGPSHTIRVEGGPGFVGWIQLNPRVTLASPAGVGR
jgi:hypothetical protein